MLNFCTECGAQLKESSKFCPSCGQPRENMQPAAQSPPEIPQQQQYIPQQQYPPPQYPQQQQIQDYYNPPPAPFTPKKKKNILPFIIAGGAVVVVIVLVLVLIFTNVFGLMDGNGGNGGDSVSSGKKVKNKDDDNGDDITKESDEKGNLDTTAEKKNNADDESNIDSYEVFGDGDLIKAPQRLKAAASADDPVSTEALIGRWEGYRNSVTTDYGFSDDGWFYKNVMITHSHLNSTYHPAYYSGDYYYYGYWTYNTTYSYTYLDTVIGNYTVKGGVIEFTHVRTIAHTNFEDNWHYKNTRAEDMQHIHNNSRMVDNYDAEFEFINKFRIRLRNESTDIDLFWDHKNDEHNVPLPKHEIPPVEWPSKALSADMPVFATNGRYREASLSNSGDDKNLRSEFKTVNVVIDKTKALSEIDAYGRSLKNSGWWVEDYELNSESSYLSYEARKGMFKLYVNNGRGSGTSDDTIVIESTKYQEGKWPAGWTEATLVTPENSVIVGILNIETGVDINVYQSVIFDKVNENGVNAYANKLKGAGFKKPYYSNEDDWDYMKYVRINGDLYLSRVRIDKRMDSLTAFNYDLSYVVDGVWPDSWTQGGLPQPDNYDTIAGAIDKDRWNENMAKYDSEYVYVKFLNLSENGITAYKNKLKSSGFKPVKDWDGNDKDDLYNYLRIEGFMIRVEVSVTDNQDITELRYEFDCYRDGVWPDNWLAGGLPAPDKYETIIGAIDVDRWEADITSEWGGSSSLYVKYLGMTEADAAKYVSKLKTAGFKPVKDWEGNDTDDLYNFIRIDGKLYRVQVERRNNYELTEFYYYFEYFEDGVWPAIWKSGGLSSPEGNSVIVGKIDLDRWTEDITNESWGGSSTLYVKYLGMTETDAAKYLTKLKTSGLKPIKDWDGNDTEDLCGYLRIDGKLYRVKIERRENNELVVFYYSFEYYEDGVWPSSWTSAGIPAPKYTAIAGAIDMTEFNDNLNSWGSWSGYIKLLGGNLSDYKATLKKSGFAEPEYSYSDTWQLSKQVQINGQAVKVTIEERNTVEIPEIYISFSKLN